MYKWIKICFIALITMSVVGCNQQKWPEEKGKIELNYQIEYKLSHTIGEKLGLNRPTSILWANDRLYISDTNDDRVIISDRLGNLIRIIGKTGNGPLEFIRPTGLAVDAMHRLYVVDSGNNRVQVIDEKGEFVNQYIIPDFPYRDSYSQMMDIALKDGLIYLTCRTLDPSWAKIFTIGEDGVVKKFGNRLVGQIVNIDGEIRFISAGEFRESKEGRSFESGRNYMVEILQDGLGEVYELPYMYTPGDIQSDRQNIYMLSKAYGTIDLFDKKGNYISTSYRFQVPVEVARGLNAFTVVDDGLLVLNSETNLVYYLQKVKE